MPFIISGLDPREFDHLRGASSEDLAAQNVERTIAGGPGFPDRITLKDLPAGARVLLLNYEHQPAPTPYRASHAIFIGEDEREAAIYRNEVPQALRDRMLSLRAFDQTGRMIDAALIDGKAAEGAIELLLADPAVAYVQAHYATRGCYAARIERASTSSA